MDIGVQTKNVINDTDPLEGFELLRRVGFTCCDFSLNSYLLNFPKIWIAAGSNKIWP